MTGVRLELVPDWPAVNPEWPNVEVAGVTVDIHDNVYAFARGRWPVRVYTRDGQPVRAWGNGLFARPHSISVANGDIWCVDDWGHTVFSFTPEGELRSRLKRAPGVSYPEFVDPDRPETVIESGPPFNYPTAIAAASDGSLLVSDGYGNARVHRFSANGGLLKSWGSPGEGPGEFRIPHGVAVDQSGLVYVSDRLNRRVQIFSIDGDYIREWPAYWPNDVAFDRNGVAYVAELGCVFLFSREPYLQGDHARVTVRDDSGAIIAEMRADDLAGDARFFAPHAVAIDSHGDLYVAEVARSYTLGQAPATWPGLRKFRCAA